VSPTGACGFESRPRHSSLARQELVTRGDLRRRLADDDGDLLVGLEDEVLRIARLELAVQVPLQPLVAADLMGVEEHRPLGEELAEREASLLLRLDVEHTTRLVRLKFRQ